VQGQMSVVWEVIGGGDKGGIVVREGKDTASAQTPTRLATGALVEEVELDGERLCFRKICGDGPDSGWASLKLSSGKELLALATSVWRVVGGGDKGGILVRTGKELSSSQAPGRLTTGALIRELEHDTASDRLRFERLTGEGPTGGWVSTRLNGGKQLLVRLCTADEVLEALYDHHDSSQAKVEMLLPKIGGEAMKSAVPRLVDFLNDPAPRVKRKAIRMLARLGEATPLLQQACADDDFDVRCEAVRALSNAAFGSIVKAEQSTGADDIVAKLRSLLREDPAWRVRFLAARALRTLGLEEAALAADLRTAARDDEDGDVRWAAADALQARGEEVDPKLPSAPLDPPAPAPGALDGRRPRVLAVHGTPSNSAIMTMQAAKFKAALGADFDWTFVDSPMAWDFIPGSQDPLYMEPSDFQKKLAKDKPFLWWYNHGNAVYYRVDEGVANLRKLIQEAEPVDVIVSFSQGSNLISLLLNQLRREGVAAPWRVSVYFCGGQIDDTYKFPNGWSSKHPTLRVYNGAGDSWFHGGELSLQDMYPDIQEFSHQDGHNFPSSQPRAGEIYKEVAREVRRHCGLKE